MRGQSAAVGAVTDPRPVDLAADHEVGHFHVYIGQEATGVPALARLQDGDVASSTHRHHGHLIARGVDPAGLLAELLGKAPAINQ